MTVDSPFAMELDAQNETRTSAQCAICMEDYNSSFRKPYKLTPCGHTFCLSCIDRFVVKQCPFDRQPFYYSPENSQSFTLNQNDIAEISPSPPSDQNVYQSYLDAFDCLSLSNKSL
jgi:hypothetical protein